MRKILRSIAHALIIGSGARHVNRLMAANWRTVLLAAHKRRMKQMRAYGRQIRHWIFKMRVYRVLRALTAPFRALWDALRGLYWRVLQPV